MNKQEIESLKRIELDILKAFVSVCSQLGIRYYLLGGTLLGAVRHQGFIPWDDDIDVGLLRSDYEIFIKEAPKLLPEYYFVQNLHSEPSCLLNFTKIRDSRTTFMEANTKNRKIHHGVFIDVFPLDYYPETQEEIRYLKRMQKELWYRIYREYTFPKNVQDSLPKEIKKQVISNLLMIKYPSYEKALLAREALYSSFPKSDLIANFCGAWGEKEIVPAEWYGQGVTVSFEGLELIAPTHYDKWLTQVYGNYMELPPVEKRVSHHYSETIDLEKPYTYYVK